MGSMSRKGKTVADVDSYPVACRQLNVLRLPVMQCACAALHDNTHALYAELQAEKPKVRSCCNEFAAIQGIMMNPLCLAIMPFQHLDAVVRMYAHMRPDAQSHDTDWLSC